VRRLIEVHPRDRAVDVRGPRQRRLGLGDLPQDGREQGGRRRVGGVGQDLLDGLLVEAERVLVLGEGSDKQLCERVHLVLIVADLTQRPREIPVA
jgi:hypothetical protein